MGWSELPTESGSSWYFSTTQAGEDQRRTVTMALPTQIVSRFLSENTSSMDLPPRNHGLDLPTCNWTLDLSSGDRPQYNL